MDIGVQYQEFSNLRNRKTVEKATTLSSSLSPSEFRNKIIHLMGLDPKSATLEYTIFGVATGPHRLPRVFNTNIQVEEAIHRVKGFIERSRKVQKGLKITNLVRAHECLFYFVTNTHGG
jgi:ribosomal protein L30/L7E